MASMAHDWADRWNSFNDVLLKVSQEIVVQRDLYSLFKRVAELLDRILRFDLVLFSVNDLDSQSIAVNIVENGSLFSRLLPLDAEYRHWASVPRVAEQCDFPSGLELLRDRGIQSYFNVPLST